ncbi:hypothetical protein [Fructobacillus cardui]|uniref:hypothetical protein n=1 Tax=Fructobacillus cardui TaxID=2893170 RepID=UPI00200A3A2B|nr:hypothetical protein [Fructobacillus cardui]MCK8628139.1 hypothetical protein [Fructobacillus cardui]
MDFHLKKKKTSEKEDSSVQLLDDKFQFNLEESEFPDHEAIENTSADFQSKGWLSYEATKPMANIWFVENLLLNLIANGNVGTVSLSFLETGYKTPKPEKGRKKKKKQVDAKPEHAVLDQFTLSFVIDRHYVHLPQAIANYFLNIRNDSVDYTGRKDYIELILDFYDHQSGDGFKDLFGLLPSVSVTLPSEEEWRTKYNEEKEVFVNAETRENEVAANIHIEKPVLEQSDSNLSSEQSNSSNQEENKTDQVSEDESNNAFDSVSTVEIPTSMAITKRPDDDMNTVLINNDTLESSESSLTNSFTLSSFFDELEEMRNIANVDPEFYVTHDLASVGEQDTNFVSAQVDHKKDELNVERGQVAETLNTSASQKLGVKIDQFKRALSNSASSFDLTHRALDRAHEVVDPILAAELNNAQNQEFKSLEDRANNQRAEENNRHDQALREIDETLRTEKKRASEELAAQYETKKKQELELQTKDYQAKFDQQKSDDLQTLASQFLSELQTLATTLQSTSNDYMRMFVKEQNDSLAKFEEQQRQIHAEAEKRAIALDEASIQRSKAENYKLSLEEKDEQLAETLAAVTNLKNREAELMAENRTLKENHVTSEKIDHLVNDKDNDFTFKDFMAWQENQQKNNPQPKPIHHSKKFWWSTSVGVSLLLLGAGAGGMKAYSTLQNTQETNQRLQKEVTKLTKEAPSSNNTKTAQTNSTTSNQSSTTNDNSVNNRPYQALDDSLKRNSLDVYRQSFSDNQLGQDSYRVFRVGQLLNQQVGRDAAVAVSQANPGYNQTLNQYLGI